MAGESGQELKVDLEDMYATAPAFSRAGDILGDAVSRATRQLEALGSFWGDDTPGQKFGAVYQPGQAKLLQLLAVISGEVAGVSDGINKMADEYRISEQANINKIRALNEEMP